MCMNDTPELKIMTRELCHELFRDWENDAAVFEHPSMMKPYVYDPSEVDRYFDARQEPSRVVFVIMLEGHPIGEVQLKRMDPVRRTCSLSIHMQKDLYKNRGYGTQAERLAVQYAFDRLDLLAVDADVLIGNVRSQRALEKAGFHLTGQDERFRYYRFEKLRG